MDHEFPFYPPLFITIMTVLATAIVAANCFVLGLITWEKSLRVKSNVFLGSLAISDIVSGLVGIPLCISCFAMETTALCVSSALFLRFTAISSVCHHLLIAGDCYAMIVHSMKYRSLVTKPRVIVAIFVIWLLAFTTSVVQLSWYAMNDDIDEIEARTSRIDTIYLLFCLAVFFAVPLCLMVYLYGRVFSISVGHIRKMRRPGFQASERHKLVVKNYRGAVVLASMLIIFSICWLPFFIVALLEHMQATASKVPAVVNIVFLFSRFSVPLFNPLLCIFGRRDFRTTLRLLWLTRLKKQDNLSNLRKAPMVHRRRVQERELDSNTENPASPRIQIHDLPRFIKEMDEY